VAAQWIRCGSVVTGHGGSPLRDMAIEVEGGLIQQVVPWSSVAATEFVDWSADTVIPGFVDAHVHLLFTCDADHTVTRTAVESSSPAQLALTGAQSAVECLLGGVTTVRDCGDKDFLTLELRDAIAAGTVPGPRILAAGPPVTVTGGHLYWCGNVADSPDDIRRATRRLCASGVDVVKVMASGGNMTHGSNPRMPQYSVPELAIVVEEAHRLGRRVAAHALNTESIRRAVAAGVDTIEHCGWRNADGTEEVDPEVVAAMAAQGTWAVVTYAGINRLLLPEFADDDSPERAATLSMSATGDLVTDFEWARTLRKAGVPMVLASDAGVRFTPFRRFDESVHCGIDTLGITASEAIGLATLKGAEALGISAEVGSIEIGKRADLVVLSGHLTDATSRLGAVRQVWRDGRVVVDHGRIVLD
jgi:imidazolonepropionase-like amidohydrolase